MAKPKPAPPRPPPLRTIAQARQDGFLNELRGKGKPPTAALSLQPKAQPSPPDLRALYRLLTSAAAQRTVLAGTALARLPNIVADWLSLFPAVPELLRLRAKDLPDYLKQLVMKVRSDATSYGHFQQESYLRGLLKTVIGKTLFERMVKNSKAMWTWMGETAEQSLAAINSDLESLRNLQDLDGALIPQGKVRPFNKLTRLERIVMVVDGKEKESTDLPFLATNPDGFQTFPLLAEIKMAGVAQKATDQMGEFLGRLRRAEKVLGYTEDGTRIEIVRKKLVIAPEAIHRVVVTAPAESDWYKLTANHRAGTVLDIDLRSTGKGGDLQGGKHYRKLLYWRIVVSVRSDWLEYPLKALLGLSD